MSHINFLKLAITDEEHELMYKEHMTYQQAHKKVEDKKKSQPESKESKEARMSYVNFSKIAGEFPFKKKEKDDEKDEKDGDGKKDDKKGKKGKFPFWLKKKDDKKEGK
jgi:hypothetical protein